MSDVRHRRESSRCGGAGRRRAAVVVGLALATFYQVVRRPMLADCVVVVNGIDTGRWF